MPDKRERLRHSKRAPLVPVGEKWPGWIRDVQSKPHVQWRWVVLLLLLLLSAASIVEILRHAMLTNDKSIINSVLDLVKTVVVAIVGFVLGRKSSSDNIS